MKKPRGYWTIERIKEEASKYSYKSEFDRGCKTAYDKACRLGIINELGFKPLGNKYNRCIYAVEFNDNHVYVGLTFNFNKRIQDHFNKITSKSSVREYHLANKEVNYKTIQLTDYINKTLAAYKEGEFVDNYRNSGWIIINKVRTGGLGGNIISNLTTTEVLRIASTYNSPVELLNSIDKSAYYFAVDHGILNKLVYSKPHRVFKRWDNKSCLEACSKYNNHQELLNSVDYSAYQYAQRHKLIDQISYKENKI